MLNVFWLRGGDRPRLEPRRPLARLASASPFQLVLEHRRFSPQRRQNCCLFSLQLKIQLWELYFCGSEGGDRPRLEPRRPLGSVWPAPRRSNWCWNMAPAFLTPTQAKLFACSLVATKIQLWELYFCGSEGGDRTHDPRITLNLSVSRKRGLYLHPSQLPGRGCRALRPNSVRPTSLRNSL